jgi:transposase
MFKAYKFSMYPDEEHKILIEGHTGSRRFVWNYFLAMRNKKYTETGKGMTYKEMQPLLSPLKNEEEWVNEINSRSIQVALQHLDTSFTGFFRKPSGYRDFKNKKHKGSFTVPQHFSVNDNSIIIPKCNTTHYREWDAATTKKFGLITVGLEQSELTAVESAITGYLIREGISCHSLKQEALSAMVG